MAQEPDVVERLVGQWAPERPDLDLHTMETVARLLHVARAIDHELTSFAEDHGISQAEGDVLFTLRRSGPPYRLPPSKLSDSLLVSSGTLTGRFDRLEAKGLIQRVPHASDRRSVEVQLTEHGRKLVDAAVTEHVANEQRILSVLSEREIDALNRITRKLLAHLSA